VEHMRIEVYGAEVELRTIASLSVPEARLLVISPYDKGSISAIEKAIQSSDLGINPSNDGAVIRLAFPPLTEERRKELVKVVKHKAEEGRVAIRNLRRAARHDLDAFEHDGDLSADDVERAEKELEKITQEKVAALEALLSHKEKELLEL
jgi:ribosome recycling factor